MGSLTTSGLLSSFPRSTLRATYPSLLCCTKGNKVGQIHLLYLVVKSEALLLGYVLDAVRHDLPSERLEAELCAPGRERLYYPARAQAELFKNDTRAAVLGRASIILSIDEENSAERLSYSQSLKKIRPSVHHILNR
jgi:hypothetical protein